jgi:hypothetical protein
VRRHPLWIIAAGGLGIRLFFAFHWFGNGDILTFGAVGSRTDASPLHAYGGNVGAGGVLYPYPPGYLPWLLVSFEGYKHLGIRFDGFVQLLPIAADLAIAIAVYVYLGWRGATERSRLAGFALVMLGPGFIAISGYHGQMDAVAILPGMLGLMVWERRPQSRRAVESGLLVGLGALIKTVPILLVVPLAVSARSLKEAAKLVACAVGLTVIVCLPFYLAEPEGFKRVLHYTGVPGRGGFSLVADPSFAIDRRLSFGLGTTPNELANWISRANGPITAIVLVALAAFLFRFRPALIDGAVLLWLSIYVFSPNFLLQYLVWGLPFFIMAGYLRETALLQLAVTPALLITYLSMTRFLSIVYVVIMIALWVFWVVALVTVALRMVRRSRGGEAQAPLVELRPALSG